MYFWTSSFCIPRSADIPAVHSTYSDICTSLPPPTDSSHNCYIWMVALFLRSRKRKVEEEPCWSETCDCSCKWFYSETVAWVGTEKVVRLLTLILTTFALAMNEHFLTTQYQLYNCKQDYNILSRIIIQFSVEKYNTRWTTSDVSIENNIFLKGIMKLQ